MASNSSKNNKDLYDYINEINKLESNLKERLVTQKNIEKPVCGLITELLLEAEISHCIGLSRNGETNKEQKKSTAKLNDSNSSVEDHDLSFKKSGLYRLLAIKLASMIEWNLYTLEKEVPLKLLYKLLETFIVLTTDSEMTTVVPDQNTLILDLAKLNRTKLSDMERHTLFAKHLFNRWCLRVYIFSRYSINWPKSLNPVSHMKCGRGNSSNNGGISDENIIRKIASLSEDTVQCLSDLVEYLSSKKSLYRPSSECIRKINLTNGTFSLDWISPHGLIPVDSENLAHSVSYDLGLYYFIQDEYKKSLGYLELVKEYKSKISSDQIKLNELNLWASELDGYLIACNEAIHSQSGDKLNTKVILLQNIMDDFKKSFVTDQLKYLNRFDLHKLLTESVVTAAASVNGGEGQLKTTTLSVSGRIPCTCSGADMCKENSVSVESGAAACEQILASLIETRALFVADTESEEDDEEDYDDEEDESSEDEEKKSQHVAKDKKNKKDTATSNLQEAGSSNQQASDNQAKKKSTAQKKKEKKKLKKLQKADEREKQKRQFEIELQRQQAELERLRKQNVELEAKLSSLKGVSPSQTHVVKASEVNPESPTTAASKKAKKNKKSIYSNSLVDTDDLFEIIEAAVAPNLSEQVETKQPESLEVAQATIPKKKAKKKKNKKRSEDADVSLTTKSPDDSLTKQSEENDDEELENSYEEETEQFHSAYTTNSMSHQQQQATAVASTNKKSLAELEDFADTDEESYLRHEMEPESFELSINNDEYLPSSSSSSSTSSTSSSSYMSTCQSSGKQPVMATKHYLNTLDEFEDFDRNEFESEEEADNNGDEEEEIHDDDDNENIDQIYLSLYKLRGNPKVKNSSPSSVSSHKISKRRIRLNELDSFSEDSPTKQMTKTSSSSSLNIMDNISRKVASLRVSNTMSSPSHQITQTLIIPVEKCSYLTNVRPNGLSNLKAIEDLTGSRLEIQNTGKKAQKSVLISGSSNEVIEFAQELVENLINNANLVDLTTLLNNSPVKPKPLMYGQPLRANINQLNRPVIKLPSASKKASLSTSKSLNPWGVNKSSNSDNLTSSSVIGSDVKPLNFAQVVAQKPLEKNNRSQEDQEEDSVIPTNLLDNIGHMWPFANQASLPPPSIHITSPSISPAPVSLISASSLLDPVSTAPDCLRLSPFLIDTASATNSDELILTPTSPPPPITMENESNSISKALLSSLGILESNSSTNLLVSSSTLFERPSSTLISPPPGLGLPPTTCIGSLDGLFNCTDGIEEFSLGSTLEQTTGGSTLLDIHDTELNKLVTNLISSNLSPEINDSPTSENNENRESEKRDSSDSTPSCVTDVRKPLVQLKAGTMNANGQNVASKVNKLNLLAQKTAASSQNTGSKSPTKSTNQQLTVNTNPKLVNKPSSVGNARVFAHSGSSYVNSTASPTGPYHPKQNEWNMGYVVNLHSPHHPLAPSPQLSPTVVQLNRQGQPGMPHFHHQMPPPPPPPFFAHHLHHYGPPAPPGAYGARLASPLPPAAYGNRMIHQAPPHAASQMSHHQSSVIYPGYNPTSQFYHMNLINHNMFPY